MPLPTKEETKKILADYREQMKKHKPSPQKLHEMRAAFGAGKVIVDVITGQRIKL
jgi:hypothetical protein